MLILANWKQRKKDMYSEAPTLLVCTVHFRCFLYKQNRFPYSVVCVYDYMRLSKNRKKLLPVRNTPLSRQGK